MKKNANDKNVQGEYPWWFSTFLILGAVIASFISHSPIWYFIVLLLLIFKFRHDGKINKTLCNLTALNYYCSDLDKIKEDINSMKMTRKNLQMDMQAEKENLQKDISKYKLLSKLLEKQLTDTSYEIDIINEINNYKTLEKELSTLQVGLYHKEYSFDISEEYQVAIKDLQKQQAEFVKTDKAFTIDLPEFLINDSSKISNKVLNTATKLILRAFNNECDAAISKITYKNIQNTRKRIESSYTQINKLGDLFGIMITTDYLKLKIQEAQLSYEYEVKKQEEYEEQKTIKEQMREEAKVQSEIAKLEKEASKEEELYNKALQKAKDELERANDEEKATLLIKVQSLEASLKAAEEKMERAKSMAQQTKSGFVYIISNIGSFGDNVYKIGMTRRLDPSERINELSNASVPFPFDVHATIYTTDAPALETQLHQAFDDYKINKVNNRKEFFKVSIEDIAKKVNTLHGDFKLTKQAEAYQYKQSLCNNAE